MARDPFFIAKGKDIRVHRAMYLSKSELFSFEHWREYIRREICAGDDTQRNKELRQWEKDFEFLLRYVVYVYDKESPLANLDGQEMIRRKALRFSYLTKDLWKAIIDDEIEMVKEIACAYLLAQGSYEWMELISLRNTVHNIMLASMPTKEVVRSEKFATMAQRQTSLLKDFKLLTKRIKELELLVFDKHRDLLEAAYRKSDIKKTYVEEFAADELGEHDPEFVTADDLLADV